MQQIDPGIKVSPTPITTGEKITVKYNGLLNKAEAKSVYLHSGFGYSNWHNIHDIKMKKKKNYWITELHVNSDDRLNLCFHDCAGNWDNNNGKNWSFEIHNGVRY